MSEDARAAVTFAEANLRLAKSKKLHRAVSRLAATYWLGKEYNQLDTLLEEGVNYRPTSANSAGFPTELDSILTSAGQTARSSQNTRPKAVSLQLALIRGDHKKAKAALETIKKEKIANIYAPMVERLRAGLKATVQTAKQKKNIKNAFREARHQLEDAQQPLHKRFADWPTERLENHLTWTVGALGGYCDPVADILAYMIEWRGYRGIEVDSGTALVAGKRLAHRGEPARALPMFLLCQKVGYLSKEGQFDESPPNPMVSFNGFEAAVYFAKNITEHWSLKNYVKNHDHIYEVAMDMYDYSLAHCRDNKSAGIAGRYGYEEVALTCRWQLSLLTGHEDDAIPRIRKMMNNGPTSSIRRKAAGYLGRHYKKVKEYGKAAEIFRRLAVGSIDGRFSSYALRMLYSIAQRSDNPAIYRQCVSVINSLIDHDYSNDSFNMSIKTLKAFRRRAKRHMQKIEHR